MKRYVTQCLIILCIFWHPKCSTAQEFDYKVINPTKHKNLNLAYIHPSYYQKQLNDNTLGRETVNTIYQNMEFDTIKLEKGRSFTVISDQNLSNNITNGIPVKFESVNKEYLAYNKAPSKITFHGTVKKTGKPRLAGKTGTIKIELEKITIDRITYPVEALISKIDNRNVYNGNLAGTPNYLYNLANAANNGFIHSSIKDPCDQDLCNVNTYTRPLLFLGAAALQTADLLLSPFVALGKRGENLNIPLNTYFEIKLDKDLYVLNI